MHKQTEAKPMKMPPTLHLDESHLAEIKEWKVGKTYKIELEVKQVSMSMGDEYGPMMEGQKKGMVNARFEVLSAKTLGEGKKEEKNEYKGERETDKLVPKEKMEHMKEKMKNA